MINKDTLIDFVVSIGPLCVPAKLMKENGIKRESFIFDWCISNPRCVIDIIKNGLTWHITNNLEQRTFYSTKYEFCGLVYHHHKYDDESDLEYMKRCANRFFKLLDSNYNVIFLYISNNYDTITNTDLAELIKVIQEKAPNINFKIIIASYLGVGDSIELNENSDLYSKYYCLAPSAFHSNHMIGEYYDRLFKTILPYTFEIKQIAPALNNPIIQTPDIYY